MRRGPGPKHVTAAIRCLVITYGVLLAGCVTVYQPMSGLHRPVAVDMNHAHLADLSLSLKCTPGPALDEDEAQDLCRKLAQLFENQGAQVETQMSGSGVDDLPTAGAAPGEGTGTAKMALNVDLSARLIHADKTRIFWWWSIMTDYTFAEDVVIRDENGFLLVKDTLTGRFVARMGFSSDADEMFSRDYYSQLIQLALNAKMRRQVLRESAPAAGMK